MTWYLDLGNGDVWASWQDPATDAPYANLVSEYGWDQQWRGDYPLEELRTGPMADAATQAEANANATRRIKIVEDALYGRIQTV